MVEASVERNHVCNLYLLSNTCFSWKRRLDQFGNNRGGAANTLSMSGYHAYSVDLDVIKIMEEPSSLNLYLTLAKRLKGRKAYKGQSCQEDLNASTKWA